MSVFVKLIDFDFLRFRVVRTYLGSGHDRLIHGGTEDGKTIVERPHEMR